MITTALSQDRLEPPDMITLPATRPDQEAMIVSPARLVDMIILSVIKSRSVAAEADDLEVGMILQPRLWGKGPMSIMDVGLRMIAKGEDKITPLDASNLTTILRQQQGGELIFFLRWQRDLPSLQTIMGGE